MFTGLIEEIGKVKQIKKSSAGWKLLVSASKILSDLKEGDSVAVDGACLTVTEVGKDSFQVDLSLETLESTYFKELKLGKMVNLERALKLGERLGGHLLLGHIDALGKVRKLQFKNDFAWLTVEFPPPIRKYIVPKGSIGVNGVSLTVAKIDSSCFEVALIPLTLNRTNLSFLKIGDLVNLETDVLGKYVENLLNFNSEEKKSQLEKLFFEL